MCDMCNFSLGPVHAKFLKSKFPTFQVIELIDFRFDFCQNEGASMQQFLYRCFELPSFLELPRNPVEVHGHTSMCNYAGVIFCYCIITTIMTRKKVASLAQEEHSLSVANLVANVAAVVVGSAVSRRRVWQRRRRRQRTNRGSVPGRLSFRRRTRRLAG